MFSLVAKIIVQVCVIWIQPIQHRDSGKLDASSLGLRALGLAFKAFLAVSEARIASPERITSQGEATLLALHLKVSLALLCIAPPLSEAKIASLLALNGASFLASWLRSLELSTLVLASRLRTFLALSVVSESNAESATLLAHREVLWP